MILISYNYIALMQFIIEFHMEKINNMFNLLFNHYSESYTCML